LETKFLDFVGIVEIVDFLRIVRIVVFEPFGVFLFSVIDGPFDVSVRKHIQLRLGWDFPFPFGRDVMRHGAPAANRDHKVVPVFIFEMNCAVLDAELRLFDHVVVAPFGRSPLSSSILLTRLPDVKG